MYLDIGTIEDNTDYCAVEKLMTGQNQWTIAQHPYGYADAVQPSSNK